MFQTSSIPPDVRRRQRLYRPSSLLRLELVAQRELHYARLRQQTRVGAKAVRLLRQRREQRRRPDALRIKPRQVRYVEHLPAELDALGFVVGHLPVLDQAHVQTGIAVATQNVARTNLAGKRQGEVLLGSSGIGERVHRAVALERPSFRSGRHLPDRRQEPVRGPALPSINTERKSAGPACDSGKLPVSDESVRNTAGIACEGASFAKRKFGDPVEVELMSEIEVRGRPRKIR